MQAWRLWTIINKTCLRSTKKSRHSWLPITPLHHPYEGRPHQGKEDDPPQLQSICFYSFHFSTSNNTKPPWRKEFQGTAPFFWWEKSSEAQLLECFRQQCPKNTILGCWIPWVVHGKGKWEADHPLLNHLIIECQPKQRNALGTLKMLQPIFWQWEQQPIATTIWWKHSWQTEDDRIQCEARQFIPSSNVLEGTLPYRQSINTRAWSSWRFYQTVCLCELFF